MIYTNPPKIKMQSQVLSHPFGVNSNLRDTCLEKRISLLRYIFKKPTHEVTINTSFCLKQKLTLIAKKIVYETL